MNRGRSPVRFELPGGPRASARPRRGSPRRPRANPAVGHQRTDDAVSYGSAREDGPDLFRVGATSSTSVGVESRPRTFTPRTEGRPACFRQELTGLDGAVDARSRCASPSTSLDEVEDHVPQRLVAHLRQGFRAGLHRPTEGCEPRAYTSAVARLPRATFRCQRRRSSPSARKGARRGVRSGAMEGSLVAGF